ncbi:unnamed protein product [Mytilus coruscus]|uniref:Tyr recombinase domain-containing protein n=1 Tax=Mytilus coruscus TaxID=42192 RepID=A0A6J8DAD6_MYTCO|nr:unnamed protein product [Mytilus coruscus]
MSGRGKGVQRKTRSSPYETQWDSNNPSNWTINKLKEELNKKGIRTPTGIEGVTPIETQQTENFADNEINTDSPSESIVPITMAESVHQQRSSVSNGENENGGTDKNKTAESQNIAQCFAGLQETFKLLINRDNTHDKSREFNLQQWYDHVGIGNRSETYTSIRGNYQGQGNTENASFISGTQNGNFSCGVRSDEYSNVDIISPSIQKQIIDDCKNQKSLKLRLSITFEILEKIVNCLRKGFCSKFTDLMLRTACIVAFYGFLRCGEFTVSKATQFDPDINLCIEDVVFHTDLVVLKLKQSKTDPFRKGINIQLHKLGRLICPYKTLLEYIQVRKEFSPINQTDPLFITIDKKPLERQYFLTCIKKVLDI